MEGGRERERVKGREGEREWRERERPTESKKGSETKERVTFSIYFIVTMI